METNLSNKRILNISEAARYSGYSRGTVEYWLREGLLPYESPPGQGDGRKRLIKIRRADLDDFLDTYYHQASRKDKGKKTEEKYEGVILLPRTKSASNS